MSFPKTSHNCIKKKKERKKKVKKIQTSRGVLIELLKYIAFSAKNLKKKHCGTCPVLVYMHYTFCVQTQ